MLLKQLAVPVYATAETVASLREAQYLTESQGIALPEGASVCVADMAFSAFPTSHDAVGSCGYRIHTADDRTCAVCTDLGCVTDAVQEAVTGCDMVLLEANYDGSMLQNGCYPPMLKARICSSQGHLSNAASAEEAAYLLAHGTTRLVLGHLSQNNNTPQCAEQTVLDGLTAQNRAEYNTKKSGLQEQLSGLQSAEQNDYAKYQKDYSQWQDGLSYRQNEYNNAYNEEQQNTQNGLNILGSVLSFAAMILPFFL